MFYSKMWAFPILLYVLIMLIFIAGRHNMTSEYLNKIDVIAEQEQVSYSRQNIIPASGIYGKLSGLYEFSRDSDRDGLTDNIDKEPFDSKKY